MLVSAAGASYLLKNTPIEFRGFCTFICLRRFLGGLAGEDTAKVKCFHGKTPVVIAVFLWYNPRAAFVGGRFVPVATFHFMQH